MLPNAVLDSAKNRISADSAILENLKKALSEFKTPSEDELVTGSDSNVRQHPNTDIEKYFDYVTKAGKPCFDWSIIKPAFLWKIKHCLHELVRIDTEMCESKRNLESEYPKSKPEFEDEDGELKQIYNFIIKKSEELDGAPFTFQRICELLENPTRHYKRADKYFRAVDKCVNVVTKVTPEGTRITGVEDFIVPSSDARIERSFYGKVDELDDDMWDPVTHVPTEVQDKPLDMSQKEVKVEDKREVDGSGDAPTPSTEIKEENMDTDEKQATQEENGSEAPKSESSQSETQSESSSSDDVKPQTTDVPNKIKEADMEE